MADIYDSRDAQTKKDQAAINAEVTRVRGQLDDLQIESLQEDGRRWSPLRARPDRSPRRDEPGIVDVGSPSTSGTPLSRKRSLPATASRQDHRKAARTSHATVSASAQARTTQIDSRSTSAEGKGKPETMGTQEQQEEDDKEQSGDDHGRSGPTQQVRRGSAPCSFTPTACRPSSI